MDTIKWQWRMDTINTNNKCSLSKYLNLPLSFPHLSIISQLTSLLSFSLVHSFVSTSVQTEQWPEPCSDDSFCSSMQRFHFWSYMTIPGSAAPRRPILYRTFFHICDISEKTSCLWTFLLLDSLTCNSPICSSPPVLPFYLTSGHLFHWLPHPFTLSSCNPNPNPFPHTVYCLSLFSFFTRLTCIRPCENECVSWTQCCVPTLKCKHM